MDEKVFESIANIAFLKVEKQYEREIDIDKSKINSDQDFFDYVEKRIESTRAHNERYTEELVKGIINFYEKKNEI